MDTERKPTYDELQEEVASLKQPLVEKDRLIDDLKARVDKLTKMLFGQKSEKSKKKGCESDASTDRLSEDTATSYVPKRNRKHGGGGRKGFPSEIPRRDVHVDLSLDEHYCDCCGREYVFMDIEITEVLNFIPMTCEVIRYIRSRYKRECDCRKHKIIIAEPPIRTIDKGSVTTEFIAAVLVNKYCDHLPIYRQVNRMFKNLKLDISESSVCRWRDVAGEMLEPLVDVAKQEILSGNCVNTDATPAPFRLSKENHRRVNGNLLVYVGDEEHPFNIFDFQENQSAKGIHEFLKGYSGDLQCDAHRNDDALFNPENSKRSNAQRIIEAEGNRLHGRCPPIEVGCHVHCRRNFVEAEEDEPVHVTGFLKLYRKLYKIEKEIKDSSIDERYRVANTTRRRVSMRSSNVVAIVWTTPRSFLKAGSDWRASLR
jgi:transposase